jgi:type IV pilus biogenesis protein CpaD/CtpE
MRALRLLVLVAMAVWLSSCAATEPQLSGALRGDADTREILRVARAKLQTLAPGAYIFRMHFPIGDSVSVYYRTGSSGPARHLVIRKLNGRWTVTDAASKIDYDLPEESVIL